jgi:hypothetical protein
MQLQVLAVLCSFFCGIHIFSFLLLAHQPMQLAWQHVSPIGGAACFVWGTFGVVSHRRGSFWARRGSWFNLNGDDGHSDGETSSLITGCGL